MNNQLVPRPLGLSVARPQTQILRRSTRRAVAAVRSDALVRAERVGAIGFVADRAMAELGFLAQKHVHLVGMVPLADGGLQMVRDAATLAVAQLVAEMGRW